MHTYICIYIHTYWHICMYICAYMYEDLYTYKHILYRLKVAELHKNEKTWSVRRKNRPSNFPPLKTNKKKKAYISGNNLGDLQWKESFRVVEDNMYIYVYIPIYTYIFTHTYSICICIYIDGIDQWNWLSVTCRGSPCVARWSRRESARGLA